MTNFSEKTSFIIESFQRDRGETSAVSHDYSQFKAELKEAVRFKILKLQLNEQGGGGRLGALWQLGKQAWNASAPYVKARTGDALDFLRAEGGALGREVLDRSKDYAFSLARGSRDLGREGLRQTIQRNPPVPDPGKPGKFLKRWGKDAPGQFGPVRTGPTSEVVRKLLFEPSATRAATTIPGAKGVMKNPVTKLMFNVTAGVPWKYGVRPGYRSALGIEAGDAAWKLLSGQELPPTTDENPRMFGREGIISNTLDRANQGKWGSAFDYATDQATRYAESGPVRPIDLAFKYLPGEGTADVTTKLVTGGKYGSSDVRDIASKAKSSAMQWIDSLAPTVPGTSTPSTSTPSTSTPSTSTEWQEPKTEEEFKSMPEYRNAPPEVQQKALDAFRRHMNTQNEGNAQNESS